MLHSAHPLVTEHPRRLRRPLTRPCIVCGNPTPFRFKYCRPCGLQVRRESRRVQDEGYRQRHKPKPEPVQLIIAPEGFCSRCGCIRLSCEDTTEICLFCQDETKGK
jgi:hypothetical protein